MVNKSEGYEYLTDPLPKVRILCSDEHGAEEITVIEDCLNPDESPWDIGAVLDACEDAYEKWLETR